MMLSQLIERKNNHATWLLAVVLFISCFTFSISTGYASIQQVKAKTELIVTQKTKSRQLTFYSQLASGSILLTNFYLSKVNCVLHIQNRLFKVHFDFITKAYLAFSSHLLIDKFVSRTSEDNLVYPLG